MFLQLKYALAAVLAAVVALLGGWSPLLTGLLVLQFLDIASGIAAAIPEGRVSSCVGWRGLSKKVGTWLAIFLLAQVDCLTGAGLSLRDAGAMWYCAIEAISVTENLGEAGVPLPQVLIDAIAVLKGKGERAT